MKLKFFALLLLTIAACTASPYPKSILRSSVAVTTLTKNSGGSGTIIKSTPHLSYVLTNAHVCRAIEAGGLVETVTHETYFVTSTVIAEHHDLCLITLNADLHTNTTLSRYAPPVGAKVFVVGHPHLLPVIITEGYFSDKLIVQVAEPESNCDDLTKALGFCFTLKTFESQVISATIQPGSSGSGVFNANGELSGVVFAGAGDFGYGLIVPLEYVYDFMLGQLKAANLLN